MKLSQIIKNLIKYVPCPLLLLLSTSLSAGPFVKIEKVEARKNYPNIIIEISINCPEATAIHGLDEENIIVLEDNYRVNYTKVSEPEPAAEYIYLIFSIDTSKSISEEYLTKIKDAAIDIINRTGPGDKVALYSFNDSVKIHNAFAEKKDALISSIKNLKREGSKTLLYNSIYDAVEIMGGIEGERKNLIVFTDGKDEGSSITEDDIIRFAKDMKANINFYYPYGNEIHPSIKRIAKLTGGKTGSPAHGGTNFYDTIRLSPRGNYIIEYRSIIKPDREKHKVEVRLRYKDIRDRDTADFYLPQKNLRDHFNRICEIIEKNFLLAYACGGVLILLLSLILIYRYIRKIKNRPVEEKQIQINEKKFPGSGEEEKKDFDDYFDRMIELEKNDRTHEKILHENEPDYYCSEAWLVQKDGPESGKKIQLHRGESVIGSGSEADVVINDKTISPCHAKIKKVRGVYYLFDLISDNGTYLNGRKLLRPRMLYDWDEIKAGRIKLIFRATRTLSGNTE